MSTALSNTGYAIIYEDAGLIAVNKPHGLAVHGGSGVSLGIELKPCGRCVRGTVFWLVHRPDRYLRPYSGGKNARLTALQKMLANKAGISNGTAAAGAWPASVTDVKPLLRVERQSGERHGDRQ